MRFALYKGTALIGTSDLEHTDGGMGVALGRFVTAPGYADVRAVFRGYADAHGDDGTVDQDRLRRMWAERDALALQVRASGGEVVPTDWVQVYDFGEEAGDEGYELEVKLLDRDQWQRLTAGAPAS